MNCENCGGPLRATHNPNKLACDYCGGLRVLDETAADAEGVQLLAESDQLCPVCHEPLHNATLDGLSAQACARCGGILLRQEVFAQIVRGRRMRYDGVREERRPVDGAELRRDVHCPACERRMETHPYYGSGGVVIDTCAKCAMVWVDRGEMRVIERAEGRIY